MALTVKQIRLRGVWLLVPPFFYFARPTPLTLTIGGALVALGLLIRAWSAGVIHKDQVLSTTGPYAHTRNPLYLGTFFLGLGACVASGQWIFFALFVVAFAWIYGSSMREEAGRLERVFGDEYRAFAEAVPMFIPRMSPAPLSDAKSSGFDGGRWRSNREWEALLGAVVMLGVLVSKMFWWPL